MIFLIGVAASVSEAATRTYIGPNNGNWSVAGHWQENAPRWMATTSTFRPVRRLASIPVYRLGSPAPCFIISSRSPGSFPPCRE